jgi:hypothetical protein
LKVEKNEILKNEEENRRSNSVKEIQEEIKEEVHPL